MSVKDPFHGLREVLLDMEPVSHLDGVRRSLARSGGIVTGAISADELDSRMGLEPTFQACGRPIRQQIDNLMILQVNQDRAIGDVATKGPIIYSKIRWSRMSCRV